MICPGIAQHLHFTWHLYKLFLILFNLADQYFHELLILGKFTFEGVYVVCEQSYLFLITVCLCYFIKLHLVILPLVEDALLVVTWWALSVTWWDLSRHKARWPLGCIWWKRLSEWWYWTATNTTFLLLFCMVLHRLHRLNHALGNASTDRCVITLLFLGQEYRECGLLLSVLGRMLRGQTLEESCPLDAFSSGVLQNSCSWRRLG